jgi:CheY-like chemotaxis protein
MARRSSIYPLFICGVEFSSEEEMSRLNRLLVVEDQPKDIKVAEEAAHAAGIQEVVGRTSIREAQTYLEKGIQGEGPLPDGILLDLDLGQESGYELLRYWHSTPRLVRIPVVIWSILGDEHVEMCKLFKVNQYVGKWEGAVAIRTALASLNQ